MITPAQIKKELKVYQDRVGELDYAGAAKQAKKIEGLLDETDEKKLTSQARKMHDMARAMITMHDAVISATEKALKDVKASLPVIKRLEREAGGAFKDQSGEEAFTRRPLVQSLNKLRSDLDGLTRGGSDLAAYTSMAGTFNTQIVRVAQQVEGDASTELLKVVRKVHQGLKAISEKASAAAKAHPKTWDAGDILQRVFGQWHSSHKEAQGRGRVLMRAARARRWQTL